MNALLFLSGLSIVTLLISMLKNRSILFPVSIVGIATAAILLLRNWGANIHCFNEMLIFDNSALAFSILLLGITFFILPLYRDLPGKTDVPQAEQFTLLLFSLIGAVLMVSYNNLLMLFIGIELLSIPIYVLAGSHKKDIAGNEASLKYFLSGAFASGFILMGIVMIYGATGSLYVGEIAFSLHDQPALAHSTLLIAGVVLMIAGFCFKIAAVPFHFWAPDVYQGAPTYITAFMSTLVKTAAIAAFYRLFSNCFSGIEVWQKILVYLAAASMLVGNFTAAYQNSLKRLLAFSSVSHAGYLLMAILSMNGRSNNAIFLYMCAYSCATIVAFSVIMMVEEREGSDHIDCFNGLFRKSPLIAIAMVLAMLSLAGIPLTAGFIGKFSIFSAAIKSNYIELTIFALMNAAVGIYYYFRVIAAVFLKRSEAENPYFIEGYAPFVIIVLSILTLFFGLYPQPLIALF